eukprot:7975842-Pyramimonas_sp.AAC.1
MRTTRCSRSFAKRVGASGMPGSPSTSTSSKGLLPGGGSARRWTTSSTTEASRRGASDPEDMRKVVGADNKIVEFALKVREICPR